MAKSDRTDHQRWAWVICGGTSEELERIGRRRNVPAEEARAAIDRAMDAYEAEGRKVGEE